MTWKPPVTWDTRPRKAIPYTLLAWFIDRHAGASDGNAAIPGLPAGSIDPQPATTPYLEIRRRHFLDRSERERCRMLTELDPVYRHLAGVCQDITGGEENVAELRTRLAAIREEPGEAALTWRNAVEQHTPDELVRARRQREHDGRRRKVQASLDQALAELRGQRAEQARLTRMIITRELILTARVRQLHEHTLRRCGTYKHRLVRKHPDGHALIPSLDLALPALPDWLPRRDPDADHLTGPRRPPLQAA
jgi:hypothetical protein